MKNTLIIICSICLLFSSCSIGLKHKIDDAKKAGNEQGAIEGKEKAIQKFEKQLSDEKDQYEKQLTSQKQKYEMQLRSEEQLLKKKVQETYNAAYQTGRESMQNDLNEIIDMNSTKQKRNYKQNWDAVKTD